MRSYLVVGSMSSHVLEAMEGLPLTNILISWFKKNNVEKWIGYLRKKHPGVSILVDSGAYSVISGTKTFGLVEVERYVRDYVRWLYRWHRYIDAAAEMDIQYCAGEERVRRWQEDLFFPLQERTGLPILFAWHEFLGASTWDRYVQDERIRWLAWGSDSPLPSSVTNKMLGKAYRRGMAVHAFGSVDPRNLRHEPFYSTDASTWLSGDQYGRALRWDTRNMRMWNVRPHENWGPKQAKKLGLPSYGKVAGNSNPRRLRMNIESYLRMERDFTKYWEKRGVNWEDQFRSRWGQESLRFWPQRRAAGGS